MLHVDGQLLILMVNFDSSTFLVGAQSSGLGAYHLPSHPGQDFEKLLSDQAGGQGPGAKDGQGARITHAILLLETAGVCGRALNILNILAYCQTNLELM